MSEAVTVYGYLVPLGADGKDIAKFPIKRQLYVIGRYASNLQIYPSYATQRWHCKVELTIFYVAHFFASVAQCLWIY